MTINIILVFAFIGFLVFLFLFFKESNMYKNYKMFNRTKINQVQYLVDLFLDNDNDYFNKNDISEDKLKLLISFKNSFIPYRYDIIAIVKCLISNLKNNHMEQISKSIVQKDLKLIDRYNNSANTINDVINLFYCDIREYNELCNMKNSYKELAIKYNVKI